MSLRWVCDDHFDKYVLRMSKGPTGGRISDIRRTAYDHLGKIAHRVGMLLDVGANYRFRSVSTMWMGQFLVNMSASISFVGTRWISNVPSMNLLRKWWYLVFMAVFLGLIWDVSHLWSRSQLHSYPQTLCNGIEVDAILSHNSPRAFPAITPSWVVLPETPSSK